MDAIVEVVDVAGLGLPEDKVAGLVQSVIRAEGARGAVVVAIVDEPTIEELNVRYRGGSGPTDVLAFPSPGSPWPCPLQSGATIPDLGEVVICAAVVRRYAEEDGRPLELQLGWTLVHGILHLLGYDHEHDEGQMRRREKALLDEFARDVDALSLIAND